MSEAQRIAALVSVPVACRDALVTLSVDGAAVSVGVGGAPDTSVFSTSERGLRLEDLQTILCEGPSVHSYSSRTPVLVSDLDSPDVRWPLFGATAADLGVGSLFAFPLRSAVAPIGVFEVHRDRAEALTADQFGDALLLADTISVLLLSYSSGGEGHTIGDGFPPTHQNEVYQAKGMLSVHLGLSLGDALARLHGHAFANGESVSAVAHEVVCRRLTLDTGDPVD
ncbi:GAF and ANTAR domain-containing protein [Nocardiopsis oceani]